MGKKNEQRKKVTAAIAGVMHYIKTEEEAQSMAASDSFLPSRPAAWNTWGMSGRQSIMQMRSLLQMRAVKGLR